MTTVQKYYVPHNSKWPIIAAFVICTMLAGAGGVIYEMKNASDFHTTSLTMLLAGLVGVFLMMYGWFKEVINESMSSSYSDQVSLSFRIGMFWFIFSELLFFSGLFGSMAYIRFLSIDWLSSGGVKTFNYLLWPDFVYSWPMLKAPDVDLGAIKEAINPMHLPLLNTILLVVSSVTLTIAHKALIKENRQATIIWMLITIALGIAFLFFQVEEYIEAYTALDLRLDSNVYGSLFFTLTGFHGFHVTLGTIILIVLTIRLIKGHFSPKEHFAFEAGAWYWHFVDVVWIALFLFVYIL